MSEALGVRVSPRVLALVCAVLAVYAGAGSLILSGAPLAYALVNAGALLLAGLLVAMGAALGRWLSLREEIVALIAGSLLLGLSSFGETAEGATRWISAGPITLQPSLILLPVLVVGFARSRRALALFGIAAASIALAVQPDRAMAGALFLALSLVALMARDRVSFAAMGLSLAAFIATLAQPDTVPPVPFVERVLTDALETPSAAGALAWLSVALLILPGALLVSRAHRRDAALLAFCGLWAGVIIASVLGNYPTSFAGYGASSVMGYVCGAWLLARPDRPD